MSNIGHSGQTNAFRLLLGVLAGALGLATLCIAESGPAGAQDVIRIGVPTKTYYPTIIAETAIRQKLFEKEGIKVELTVYRSGAETFEAMAAGAADIIMNSSSLVAAGLKKGVHSKVIANTSLGYYGWYLVVLTDSPIKSPADLAGKKVGMTAAGSGSDLLARWTQQDRKVEFTRVPLGGGGLVPNLLTKNVDATVLYSPLTYKVFQAKQARSLIDFGQAIPEHSTGAWIATDKIIKEKPQLVQKTLNAIYGGLAYLQNNHTEAVKLIATINEIPPEVAEAEVNGNINKLSKTGEIKREWMVRSLDLAQLIGMTNLAPVDDTFVTNFTATPTQ
jgi:NitT/TauT family transport system substrate-binding protein